LTEERREDLWSGLGLAIVYAGGASLASLRKLASAAGTSRATLAQGAAFAAEAHLRAGHLPAHTEEGALVLTGMSAGEVAIMVRRMRNSLPAVETSDAPRYEVWRRQVRQALSQS